jgi:hypothetical protein
MIAKRNIGIARVSGLIQHNPDKRNPITSIPCQYKEWNLTTHISGANPCDTANTPKVVQINQLKDEKKK